MPHFKAYNYDQSAIAVINYQDQLQPGTFEQAVHYLVKLKHDLFVFYPKYRNGAISRLSMMQLFYKLSVLPTQAIKGDQPIL
ncbi:transposase [Halomonas sp. Mc5H-6]|uniref:transposase n=2 Tax=unclassified Halomonas TaxID=2609666 RepID=UPI002097C351|nr:transposase [Halomonas sp. Mc5H-6]MCO7246912.1 transposase [Halomonas sp. Mc5H-6]